MIITRLRIPTRPSSRRCSISTASSEASMPPPPAVPTNFQEVLEQIWWRLDTALDLEMIRWSAMLGALEALDAGGYALPSHVRGLRGGQACLS